MRKLLVIAMMLALVGAAVAADTGNRLTVPEKPVVDYPENVPNDIILQGGDTILDAVQVTIPVIDGSGTTAGFTDDYDEACPYTGSTSPDVVYTFTPGMDMEIDVDMCGSTYDTKIYIYDANVALVACNDDFYGFGDPCGSYVSKLEAIPVVAGTQYFLVIDGYGGQSGDYTINITENVPCVVECPAGAVTEGEPPLVNDYEDLWNGGCNTNPDNPPLQPVSPGTFCGVAGLYDYFGSLYRDTDWLLMTIPDNGVLEVTGDAEETTILGELEQDCSISTFVQFIEVGPCAEGTLVIQGEPGSDAWVWVGKSTGDSPTVPYEYDYVLFVSGVVATQDHSWTSVKSLFD